MKKIFVLKDNNGNYVDKTSMYYDKYDKRIIYDCYDNYKNTVILYYEKDADTGITYLNEKAKEYNLDYSFTKELVPDYSD